MDSQAQRQVTAWLCSEYSRRAVLRAQQGVEKDSFKRKQVCFNHRHEGRGPWDGGEHMQSPCTMENGDIHGE